MHLAWSGDQTSWAERRPDGRAVIGAGEQLGPGEVVLAPGESYRTPDVLAVWSGEGLDGLSKRLHRHVRARPSHPRRPRPVVLNTWEAVYFDHRLDRLSALADVAATVGVERFVLDDGWFMHRRARPGRAGGLDRRPGRVAAGLGPADRARPRARHGVRALGRAGDGEHGLRPLPGPPRLGAAGRRQAARPVAAPASARPGGAGGVGARVRAARRAPAGPPDRLPQVGPQP